MDFYRHICGLIFSKIRILIYIFILSIWLSSCVDDLPIPVHEENNKIFVICEMKVGSDIIADIVYTGNIKGSKARPVEDYQNYTFGIAEGVLDFAFDFKYNGRDKKYFIDHETIRLKEGVSYKFKGLGSNVNFTDPTVIIPKPLEVKDVNTEIVESSMNDGKYYTKIKCSIKLGKDYGEDSYFYLIPSIEGSSLSQVTFEKDFHAYKKLSHKNGFLVDYKRITTDNEISFYVELNEEKPSKEISIEFGNVTPSFYLFNYYYSNLVNGIEYETANPAIAGLNIKTDQVFGTFSANNSFTKKYPIK